MAAYILLLCPIWTKSPPGLRQHLGGSQAHALPSATVCQAAGLASPRHLGRQPLVTKPRACQSVTISKGELSCNRVVKTSVKTVSSVRWRSKPLCFIVILQHWAGRAL